MTSVDVKRLLRDPATAANFFALCGYGEHDIIEYLMERLNLPRSLAVEHAREGLKFAAAGDEAIEEEVRANEQAIREEWTPDKE